jgi:urate oxidase
MSEPVVRRQSYGKSQVRLSRVHRGEAAGGTPALQARHEFIELTLSIGLAGDFDAAYTAADNSLVVPTDTMKNTVYVLAQQQGVKSAEQFVQALAAHFLQVYAHVVCVEIHGEEHIWSRMVHDGREHPHAFTGGGSERNTCSLIAARDGQSLRSGLKGLVVLKTTGSGFAGFWRDRYTTLPETDDRILATSIEATWPCLDPAADWSAARKTIRAALVEVFANQYSKSVQQTLYEMGRAALDACRLIEEIEITMPNQHHVPVNLAPFGLANAGEVFMPTSEPFGRISATIARRV